MSDRHDIEAAIELLAAPEGMGLIDAVNYRAQEYWALLRRVDAVLAIHLPFVQQGSDPICRGCWEAGGYDGAPAWPCPTARALGATE